MKTGGSVSKAVAKCYGGKITKKTGGKIDDADIKQDKAIVKKAFGMHDSQQHEGEKTDLSKLKKGGRSKKETGTVRKFKSGGSVTNVYEAKKSSGDKDNIRKTKDIKPSKAAAPSKAATKPAFKGSDVAKEKSKPAGHKDPYIKSKESGKKAAAPSGAKGPDKFKKGGKIVKKAIGGGIGSNPIAKEWSKTPISGNSYEMNYAKPTPASNGKVMPSLGPANNFPSKEAYEKAGSPVPQAKKKGGIAKKADGGIMSSLKDNIIGTPEQNRIAQANMDKQAAGGSKLAKFLGGNPNSPTKPVAKKTGGKIKKMADGGSFSPEQESWLGGADRTDPFILARMRAAVPDSKTSYIPNANPAMDNRDVGMAPAPTPTPAPSPAPVALPVRRQPPVIAPGPSADERLNMKYGRDQSDADSRLRNKYGKSEWDQTNVPLPKVSEWDDNSKPLPAPEGISAKLARILGVK